MIFFSHFFFRFSGKTEIWISILDRYWLVSRSAEHQTWSTGRVLTHLNHRGQRGTWAPPKFSHFKFLIFEVLSFFFESFVLTNFHFACLSQQLEEIFRVTQTLHCLLANLRLELAALVTVPNKILPMKNGLDSILAFGFLGSIDFKSRGQNTPSIGVKENMHAFYRGCCVVRLGSSGNRILFSPSFTRPNPFTKALVSKNVF